MSLERIALGPGPAGSPHVDQPDLADVVARPETLPDRLVRPLIRVDGGLISARWAGLPLCVFAHEVGVDALVWQVEAGGRYTLLEYDGLSLADAADPRAALEAHLIDTYDSLEEFADEMEETFDDVDPPRPLAVGDGRISLAIQDAVWLQGGAPPPASDPHFAFALDRHPHLFGCYFLFVDADRRRVRQVFQCT